MNRYLAELEDELQKNRKTPHKSAVKTVKRAFSGFGSSVVGHFSEKNIPYWCSRSCPSLMVLHTPQGKLTGCRQEYENKISWVRLSFMKGCPMKIGRAAMNDRGWPDW